MQCFNISVLRALYTHWRKVASAVPKVGEGVIVFVEIFLENHL